MIDKQNSDEDFSDEGFDEEFSFDAEEDHTEIPMKTKGGRPWVLAPVKKVLINLVLGLSLIASIFGVYQYWSNTSKQKALAKKTMSILPSPKASSTSKPAVSGGATKEESGAFTENEVAALKREEAKSATNKTASITEKSSDAQKGVFVFKAPVTETVTVSKTEIKETKTSPSIKPAEAAMTALEKAESEQKILEQKALVQQTLEQIKIIEDQKASAQKERMQKELAQKELAQKQKEEEQKELLQKTDATMTSMPSVILSPTPTTAAMISPLSSQPGAAPPLQPSMPTSAEVQEMTKEINKTLEAVSKLNQQMEGNLNQVKYVDAYTREVSLNVEKLNAQVATMDNRIQALTNLANTLSKDLGKVRHEVGYAKRVAVAPEDNLDLLSPPKRQRADCPIDEGDCGPVPGPRRVAARSCVGCPEDPEYVVHAVIPGRAWLKSCKGQILTVTEGETVGNYGKVLVIDAANSIVLTSSGIAFR